MHRFAPHACVAFLVLTQLAVAQTVYTSKSAFQAAFAGPSIIENYTGIPSSSGFSIPDAQMDAFFGETDYTNTGTGPNHQVFSGYYNASTPTFRLDFSNTSIAHGGGVFAAGIEYAQFGVGWNAYVTFADGSVLSIPLLTTLVLTSPAFFGVTSLTPIVSIDVGTADGTPGIVSGSTMWLEEIVLGARDHCIGIGGGCPGETSTACIGTPSSSNGFSITCSNIIGNVCFGGPPVIMFGRCLTSPLTLPASLTCGACDLLVSPVWGTTGSPLTIAPGLPVGLTFCVQCGCVASDGGSLCLNLSGGSKIIVGP
ncbi:MAG: hypothetical protein KDB80_13010 [Planctomycetes bacterium]|nr:hypothetical protein [Planctomycetota bacterium]